jgi:hypothetical protein
VNTSGWEDVHGIQHVSDGSDDGDDDPRDDDDDCRSVHESTAIGRF